MKTLSIIIPYYKTLEYTKKLFETLTPQLTEAVEVIVVDDGCNETELDKLKAKVIHLKTPSGNASKPRNVGLDIATGKYIAFIDSDDNVTGDYITTILNKIKITTFDYCYISWDWKQGNVIINNEPPTWNTCVWNCIYKRELIGSTRFNCNKNIGEDEDFNNKVRRGKRENITKVLYHYTWQRPNSLTVRYSQHTISRETTKCGLLVYQKYVSKIGGIETFLYYFLKALSKDYDILFVYREADVNQLKRYKQLVRCMKFNKQFFECDKYLCVSNQDNIADYVTASTGEYYDMIHADFSAMNWTYKSHQKTTKHIAVSEIAKKGMRCNDNKPCVVIYNLLELVKPKKPIRIMSAQRFSVEKGESEMKAFSRRCSERGIPVIWVCFTDNKTGEEDGIIFKKPVLDIENYYGGFDYFASFSRTESYGYSMVEAMSYGLPLLVRDIPVLDELGFVDGEHGYKISYDMSNMDEVIDKMVAKIPKCSYKKLDNVQQWYDLLGDLNKYNDYDGTEASALVECIRQGGYDDVELGRHIKHNEQIIVPYDRAEYLAENSAVKILEIIELGKNNI